ncbi:MAG: sensor histidine kinase [Pedosphaera sp.]|nr:sensor histidine kinase [Pedosphaera sp.]
MINDESAKRKWNERPNAATPEIMETESMFRLLFERSADGISILDPSTGTFLDINDASVRMTGAPDKATLLRGGPALISPIYQPDGSLSEDKLKTVIQLAFAQGSYRFEWVLNRFDGTELPVEIVLTPISSGDRPLLLSVGRDISERKKTEAENQQLRTTLEKRISERTAELAASEAQLRTLLENAPEAIVVFDGDTGRFLIGNANACRLYGCTAEELTTLTPMDVSPKLQANGRRSTSISREKIREALAGGTPVFEWIHRHSSGRLIHTEVRLVRMPAEGRNLLRASVIDNTERIRAEQALRDSEQKFRALFEASSQGVMLHDDKQFLEVNPAAVRILGYTSQAEFVGKHPSEISPPFQPDGQRSDVLAAKHITECMTRGSTRFEWLSRHVTGRDVPLEVILTRIEIGGRTLIQAITLDITERKAAEEALRKSEEKFKQLYEMSPLGMAQVNWDGSFVQVNPAFANIIGYTREEVTKLTYWDVTPREYEQAELAVLEQLRTTGRFGPHEKEYFHKDGHRVPVVLNGMVVTAADGKDQMWGIVENITERKRAEAELHNAIAREKELGQLRSNFVSMVSHEFRTPLGIIMSSAEILSDYLERLDQDERQEHLHSISRNARRMGNMMEEVLVLSLFDAGKMEFKPKPLDLPGLCARLVDELLSVTDRRCPIELHTGGITGEARADEGLVRHIFTNLLTNAVKYSEAGQPVTFDVRQNGTEAVCVIRDRGIGIPAEDREWLFTPFQRGRNVGQRPGTGLGLVIVKRCLDRHGGTIELDSAPGQGTAVTVRLPLFIS